MCAKPFTRDGGGAIATTNDHEPPTPPLLLFRTSHPPYNTHVTQHAIPGGQESRCSGPKLPVRDRPGSDTRFWGFAQLTASRSRLARTRHHRRQSHVTPEFCGVIEFRCPGPTPSDAASSVEGQGRRGVIHLVTDGDAVRRQAYHKIIMQNLTQFINNHN